MFTTGSGGLCLDGIGKHDLDRSRPQASEASQEQEETKQAKSNGSVQDTETAENIA